MYSSVSDPVFCCSFTTSLVPVRGTSGTSFPALLMYRSLVSKESPDRKRTLGCLRNVEVYKSERVVIEWTVTTPTGETKYGSAESGRVASKSTPESLKIFIAQDGTDASLPPLELQEELAKVCDINSKENFALLLYVLMQHELRLIEETLDRKGLSKELLEFDDIKGRY